jgi:hypothetical protein
VNILQIGEFLHVASHSPIDGISFQNPSAPGVIIASVLLVIVNSRRPVDWVARDAGETPESLRMPESNFAFGLKVAFEYL